MKARARNLLQWAGKHWHATVFVLALLSLFLLRDRLHVQERHVAEGEDALEVAFEEYEEHKTAAAARTVSAFLDRYPEHPSCGRAHLLLAQCRIDLAQDETKPDRLVLALEALHEAETEALRAAETEGYEKVAEIRAKRLDVARQLGRRGALRDALDELAELSKEDVVPIKVWWRPPAAPDNLAVLSKEDRSLHLEVAGTAEKLIDEVDPVRVAAVAVSGLVAPGPAASLERVSALERAMRSPMLETALAALEAHAKTGGEAADLTALVRRGRLYLSRRFYSEAIHTLTALLAEVERQLPADARSPLYPERPQPGGPWPRSLSVLAREAYESRGLVYLARMRTWSDPARADLEFLRAVNDLGRAEELALRDQDVEAAERASYRVARAYQVHGDIPGAIARYQRLLSSSPTPVAAYAALARLGQIFLVRKDEEKGLDHLTRALAKAPQGVLETTEFPDLPVPSLLLTDFPGDRREPGRLEAAARVAEAYTVQFPADAALLGIVGAIRERLGEGDRQRADEAGRCGQPSDEVERLREEARTQFERAAKAFALGADGATGERAIRMRHRAGVAYARAGDPFRAVTQLETYLDICARDDRGQPEALYELARAELAKGDQDRALVLFDRLEVEYPNNLLTYQSQLDVARIHHARGDLDTAIGALNRILSESDRIQPDSEVWKEAKFEIGHTSYELARQRRVDGKAGPAREAFRAARRELEQALTWFPDEARLGILALDTLAQIAVDDEEWKKALEHLTHLLRLGDAMDAQGNTARLEEPYATVYNLALVRKADCEFRLGRLTDAVQSYREAQRSLMRRPEVLDCLLRIAICQRQLGQAAEASVTIEQAHVALDRLVTSGEIDEAGRTKWLEQLK